MAEPGTQDLGSAQADLVTVASNLGTTVGAAHGPCAQRPWAGGAEVSLFHPSRGRWMRGSDLAEVISGGGGVGVSHLLRIL